MASSSLWVLILDEDKEQARAIERTLTPFGIGTTIVESIEELVEVVRLAQVDAIIANVSSGNTSQRTLEQRLHAHGVEQELIVIDSNGSRQDRRVFAAPVSPIHLVDAVLSANRSEQRRAA